MKLNFGEGLKANCVASWSATARNSLDQVLAICRSPASAFCKGVRCPPNRHDCRPTFGAFCIAQYLSAARYSCSASNAPSCNGHSNGTRIARCNFEPHPVTRSFWMEHEPKDSRGVSIDQEYGLMFETSACVSSGEGSLATSDRSGRCRCMCGSAPATRCNDIIAKQTDERPGGRR